MRSVITYFIKYPITGNILMFMIIIFGYFGLRTLQSTYFPEVESRQISIRVIYPGASPAEVEEGVVSKIEKNLKGVTGLERVTSVSSENAGNITVEVLKGYDTNLILQDVKNAVDQIASFPVGMEPPVVYIQEGRDLAISFALSAEVDLQVLKKFARKIENEILAEEGISKIEITGFPEEEIEVAFRENDLRAYNLTFAQASDAIRKANIDVTGGTIKGKEEELLIRAKAKKYYGKELENLVLKADESGYIIRVKDVADVIDKWSDNPNRSYLNKKKTVIVNVSSTIEEDMLSITDFVRNYVQKFNKENKTIKATIIQDRSINLQDRIDLLVDNGLVGLILVLIFLSLFLNFHLSYWVALGIPISFLGMFILGAWAGITINVISLFGMILVIGILVDDGIVIGENIYQLYEEGKDPETAAIEGTLEVFPAVFTAVITTIVAFSFFFFIDGRIGDFFSSMAFVVIATLLFSLVEGALILPAHVAHSKALNPKPDKIEKIESLRQELRTYAKRGALGKYAGVFFRHIRLAFDLILTSLQSNFDQFMRFLRNKLYAPVLNFCMYNKAITLALFLGLLLMTIAAVRGGIIRTTFFPNIERESVDVTLTMPAGTSEEITEAYLTQIEGAIEKVNEENKKLHKGKNLIIDVQKNLGPTTHEGNIKAILLEGEQRKFKALEVASQIRKATGEIKEADKVTFGTRSAFGKPVSVALISYDRAELEKAKQEFMEALQANPRLSDVVSSEQEGLKEVNIQLKEKAYLLGLQLQDVVGQVRQGFFGFEAQRIQRGEDEVKIWVRYAEEDRSSIQKLEDMRIRLPDGKSLPLHTLADFTVERGISSINHLDGQREISVEADLANPDDSPIELLGEIRSKVAPEILAKYPSVSTLYEGQNRQAAKTGKSAGVILPIILIIMAALVVLTFRSFWQMVVLAIDLPFGLIGVGWGHYLHDKPMSILSMLGVVALVGVMINDSLVFITAFNNYLKKGEKFIEAVYKAGLSRFRPILLTTLTTIAGLAPLMFEKSFQAQFLIPMAISLAYGLLLATLTTLLLLPVLLVLLNQTKVYVAWFFTGKKPSMESVEPAIREMKHQSTENL